jgi:hypothetical protein
MPKKKLSPPGILHGGLMSPLALPAIDFFLQRADCADYRCCRHLALHNEARALQLLHQAAQAI